MSNLFKVDASFFTATCSLYSLDMGEEMDLIRQRTQNDSGHGLTYTPHKTMRLSDGTAAPSHPQGSEPTQLPSVAKVDPAVINSTRTTVRNDSGHMDDLLSRSYVSSEQHAREMSLGQNAASSSSIMSFSPGSRPEAAREDDNAQQCIVRNLIGSSVTAGMKLVDMDGLPGIFFVFPDLSIRKDGEYRLRFSFFNLQADNGELITTVTQIKAHTFSEPFKVYSAKQFPGMIESTELSKHFAKQGVKIPVRKESIKSSDF
ncbi:hypothetical protein IWW40_000562 [Coemansia sp. RSA 1250]|nr:hypothetical protein IWW40_000562 [Coemansia sp. RSA 1250]